MKSRLLRRRKLEQSFAASTILLVVVLIGATMVLVHSRLAATLRDELTLRGRSIARSIGAVATPSLLAYNYAALQLAAESASGDNDVAYVVIHDKEGAYAGLAGRLHVPTLSPLTLPRASLEPASCEVDVDDGHGHRERVVEVAVPVRVEGVAEPWGTVRVGLSLSAAAVELRRVDLGLLALGVGLALLTAATARLVARRITAPIRRLAAGTEALSGGDMTHRIPVTGAKELADLARAFNVMMDRVQDKARESGEFQRQLEALNATLEEQVRQRTKALEESEAQYKTLVEHSPDAILIIQEERIRFVSRAFGETFGIPNEAALAPGFDVRSLFEAGSAQMIRERIRAWEEGESASPIEVLGKDASGRLRHLEARGSRIEYLGRPAVECLLIDTTETSELRDRLGETEKLRSLGELAGGVAHDFNNLLGAILGRSQLLRRRGLEPEIDADLAVIEKAAQDGRETVRRIQEFSRVRKDRRFTNLDLREILRDAVEITRTRWKAEAESRNVSIDVSVDTDAVPPIQGNAAELREVLTNLILNAVDAMPEGGELRLRCKRAGERVRVEVQDTGVGMTDKVRRHLFDPFFSTKGSGGMGLGLSVVYGIVTRHGGSIEVQTGLGKGTNFVLEFPVSAEPLVVAGGDGAEMPRLLRPGRVLVIDDELEIAQVLRDILALNGHTAEIAMNGHDGVRLASASTFELILTDLGMPDMSGWEVAEQIHTLRPDLPVILVTGWAASLDEGEARSRGIAAVLHKPFEIEEVLRTTSEILVRLQPHARAN